MFAWVNGAKPPPPDVDTPLFRKLRTFHRQEPEETDGEISG